MVKKYLTTIEDLLALKDTDTKIYIKGLSTYYQYVGGVLCRFHENYPAVFNCGVELNGLDPLYILVEEPVKEADENDIGYLCYFYEDDDIMFLGILDNIDEERQYCTKGGSKWTHCKRLSPAEVAEITGYKVE